MCKRNVPLDHGYVYAYGRKHEGRGKGVVVVEVARGDVCCA